jgi:short-subunit dehydrogenase
MRPFLIKLSIGWALAVKFVETGTSVIVVGRRKEKLDEFAKQYGNANNATVDTAVLDITDLKGIPKFAADITQRHPDLVSLTGYNTTKTFAYHSPFLGLRLPQLRHAASDKLGGA